MYKEREAGKTEMGEREGVGQGGEERERGNRVRVSCGYILYTVILYCVPLLKLFATSHAISKLKRKGSATSPLNRSSDMSNSHERLQVSK